MDLSENIINEFEDITQSNTSDRPAKKVNKITKIGIITSLDEFAQNSTLHGLRFIVDRTLNYVEKLFWLIVVIVSIVMCSFLIHNMWFKWQSNPIIITMNENLVPVDSVYYPSLTICPQIKIKKNSYDFETERNNYQQVMWSGYNETPSHKIRLSKVVDIAYMCDADVWDGLMNFPMPYHTVNIDNIRDVALDFEDIFKTCEWNTNSIPCDTLYQKVITQEGVCFTMNALNADEIIRGKTLRNKLYLPNKRYRQNLSTSVYPFKGSVNDASAEFAMTLKEYFDYDDKSCRRYSTGFYVYLQDPADMPQATIHSYVVKPNQIVSLALKLDSVSTSEDLKLYSIQTRQCYFPDEPYLKFFRTYTESNCRLECFANYTKQLCGCATFYMPRGNATPICDSSEMYCVNIAEILLYGYITKQTVDLLKELYSYLNKYTDQYLSTQGREFADACKCLPTCNTVNYDADVMEIDYDFEYYFNSFCNRLENCDTYNESYKYAKIEWIFKRHSFVGMTRTSIFGVTDFIAQCGGLLGLFLGFSFLTAVEIIYYVTLRLGCIIRREKLSKTLNERDLTV
ncbi:hypothetical protein K1T71_011946 [Dendrolimus kikuchii]|uniref:Uncharacterized protein n=1 Tax=Dendrolimus kikuchii TaxID=765133 RepID=A0ACC1CMT6_9NEOP|nr:hypothetical protein K1T71_011946 [Dendrolimus kikuchii]